MRWRGYLPTRYLSGRSAVCLPQRLAADGLQIAQICMAALGRPQECLGYSFTGFVIAAARQLPTDGFQRHVQIGGSLRSNFFMI